MLVILTKRDLQKDRKFRPIFDLRETQDFRHYPHAMPSENMYEYFSIADTLAFLGCKERKKSKQPDGRIFHMNKKAGTDSMTDNENIIATLIRQLAHEQEIAIDFVNLVKAIAASLTSSECAKLAEEFEKDAFRKA
jgi:hypothetical protein